MNKKTAPKQDDGMREKMNAYALRVWNGQSPDLPVRERHARIIAALRGQGFSGEVDLPSAPDPERKIDETPAFFKARIDVDVSYVK